MYILEAVLFYDQAHTSSEPVMYTHNKLDLSNVIVFNLIDANKYQYQYQLISCNF